MTKISQGVAQDPTSPWIAGDSRIIECTVTSGGSPFNLTGAAITWQVFQLAGGTFTGSPILTKIVGSPGGITITNAAGGVFQIALDPIDTEGLSGSYYHEAEITMPGNLVHTVFTGLMTITPGAVA